MTMMLAAMIICDIDYTDDDDVIVRRLPPYTPARSTKTLLWGAVRRILHSEVRTSVRNNNSTPSFYCTRSLSVACVAAGPSDPVG